MTVDAKTTTMKSKIHMNQRTGELQVQNIK
jgi:hypothetical protein